MDYLIVFLLIANITVAVVGLKQLKKAITADSERKSETQTKREFPPEEKKARELRERQMANFLGYSGDKQ